MLIVFLYQREQKEMLRLQVQREQQQRLQAQQMKRKQLNQSYRMKMKRLAKEQQEELALDMCILQQVLHQETDEKVEAAQRKVSLHIHQSTITHVENININLKKLIEAKMHNTLTWVDG